MKPMPEDWDRAVAIVAHPDDLEYGVASAVARWTRQGKQVSYLLATRGEAGIDGMDPAEAEERVIHLRVYGPTAHAFSLREHFPPPDAAEDSESGPIASPEEWNCPA